MQQASLLPQLFDDEVYQQFTEGDRADWDFYPTDPRLVRPLFPLIPFPKTCFEPMSGQSAIANTLKEIGVDVVESDIQWEMGDLPQDATDPYFWEFYAKTIPTIGTNEDRTNWATVTNPAFSVAPEFMSLAFKYSPWGVVALLRLSFIEPCDDRKKWLLKNKDHLRKFIPINPRHKFKPGGNDSVTCAWYWFDPNFSWEALGISCPFDFIFNWKQ